MTASLCQDKPVSGSHTRNSGLGVREEGGDDQDEQGCTRERHRLPHRPNHCTTVKVPRQ